MLRALVYTIYILNLKYVAKYNRNLQTKIYTSINLTDFFSLSQTSTAPHPTAFTAPQQIPVQQQHQQPQQPQFIAPQHCWKTPGAENAPPGM